ncbi:MAG TPA: nuclear transport factor 2 family protein [Polyangiaceae bacterium]|nr:nuclear transport factor 2 family protein [Polyangiaceae bacterium]
MNALSYPATESEAVLHREAPVGAQALALRFFELLNQREARAALALFDPQASIEIIPAAVRGMMAKEGRLFVDALLEAFPDLWIQVRSVMETEDLAVVEIKMEGTQATDFLGILNQEKHLDLDQAWMLWAVAGKLTGVRAYWCQNQLYRRLAVKRLDRVYILG